jgi:drug/metabolite transporter (DMT)-like permease
MAAPASTAPARVAGTDWLLFLVPSFIWGTTWYAIKFQLGAVAPELSVAYRFALAALLLLGWCRLRGIALAFDWRSHLRFALLGVLLFGANYVLVYLAELELTSGVVALLFGSMVVWNLLGARLFFGTRLTAAVVFGAALGLLGVALVVWPDLARLGATSGHVLGVSYALVSTMAASGGNLWSQRLYRGGAPVVPSTAWGMLYGALAVALLCLVRGLPLTIDGSAAYLVSLAYLAVFGSIFAFVAYLTLLRRIGSGRAGYTAVVIPVMAMATSTVFEGYRWTVPGLVGMALVLVGNVLILQRRT